MSDANPPPPVIFGIPLIARAVANDWSRIVHQFSATLGSLYGQTDPNFHIIVAGTDEPDVDVPRDARYEFVLCPSVSSLDYSAKIHDVRQKRLAVARQARKLGGGYLMFVDADDLVSSGLVSSVRNDRHPHGYLVTQGYLFDAASGAIAPYPLPGYDDYPFDCICGTSTIVRFAADDLPEDDDQASIFHRIFGNGHAQVRRRSFDEGRPLAKLPIRGAAYVRGTLENMSETDPSAFALQFYRELMQRMPAHTLERTPELDREFNLPAALYATEVG